jgi:two-component system nitrogen regulation sensor histidine kinase NtrY
MHPASRGDMAASPRQNVRLKRPLNLLLLGGALLVMLLAMSALNAFNLVPTRHGSPLALFVFTAVTVVLFLVLLLLLVLLARNILKMYGDGHSRVFGSRLRSRLLLGALLLSFAPIVFMALFSFLLMNRSLDRWFSQPVSRLRDDSLQIALQLSRYVSGNARAEAESLARAPEFLAGYNSGDPQALTAAMRQHRITLEGGFIFVYRDGQPVASYEVPPGIAVSPTLHTWPGATQFQPPDDEAPRRQRLRRPASDVPPAVDGAPQTLSTAVLRGAENTDGPMLSLGQGNDFALGAASLGGGGVVAVALPLPTGLGANMDSIAAATQEYWVVYRERRTLRGIFLLLLTLVTTLAFFAATWLALFLSKQITQPVEALADAMDAIAAGDYQQRIAYSATEELSELIGSFNQMATDLEESRLIADSSTAQIEQVNRRLRERQHELELILETIPSGVVVLDGSRSVLQVNRTFLDLLAISLPGSENHDADQLHGQGAGDRASGRRLMRGINLEDLLPREILEEVLRLERRAQRMGVAGVELELPAPLPGPGSRGSRALSLSVTIAVLNLGRDGEGQQRRGSVLVLDDMTEVLQAQRQVAWKEVAQRVAHEIKNPLTPISLSAERVLRHIERPTPDSAAVIRRCSEVILSSVESMRLLVDQFGALAEFPAAQPRAASLNEIAENALLLFHGRLEGIRIERSFMPGLPPVLADPEALKRALANLIDNAAEAMNASRHRVLRLETSLSERTGMAELLVSDTGPGLSQEVRERLFLPYFSTKQRGTGLGLAIAAKIIQDHHGHIRAEQRGSTGACFILDLPLARTHEAVAAGEIVPA